MLGNGVQALREEWHPPVKSSYVAWLRGSYLLRGLAYLLTIIDGVSGTPELVNGGP